MRTKRNRPGGNRAASQNNKHTNISEYTATTQQVWAYEAAVEHLLGRGLLPAPDVDALRSMWKAGGRSRRVAEIIAHRWEMAS